MLYSAEMARFKSLEDVVERAVDSLLESRRQVVKLYLLNLSIQEISSYLNWSVDKTRNLLYRGLADLKKKLRNADIQYDSK
jgi:DNA-directed RNA polymerase specialized sigma24 family protein